MHSRHSDSLSPSGVNNHFAPSSPQINALFPYNRPGDSGEHEGKTNFLYEFWNIMFRIAPQLHYNQEPIQRFIALIKALRQLPEIIFEDGKTLAGREGWGDPAECDGSRAAGFGSFWVFVVGIVALYAVISRSVFVKVEEFAKPPNLIKRVTAVGET